MAEMPFDVIRKHLLGFVEEGYFTQSSDITVPEPNDLAIEIDQELQKKFLFLTMEEIQGVEIREDGGRLFAGSGTEECTASGSENPNRLFNHGLNALALWWHLKTEQEKERRIKARPAPGWYVFSTPTRTLTGCVTAEKRILVLEPEDGLFKDYTSEFDDGVIADWKWATIHGYELRVRRESHGDD